MSKLPAILSISFRPFFILVALIAVFNPMTWVLNYLGYTQLNLVHVSPLFWHGHEMIFAFSGAMIAGFILTASANWTSSAPYKGRALFALILIWLFERLSYFLPINISQLFIVSNLFLPLLTIMLFIKLKNFPKQKYVFIPILLFLTCGKLMHSWGHLFEVSSFEIFARQSSLGLLRLIVLLIAGRVVPFFSSKKLDLKISVPPYLNLLSLISVILLVIPSGFLFNRSIESLVLIVAIVSNTFRMVMWRPEKSIKIPILFILHLGIGFIILSLIFEFLSLYYPEFQISQAPLHMLMAAGVGTVGIGMMSRVSLGHTGRVISADLWIKLAYVLIVTGGFLRASLPVLAPNLYIENLILITGMWSSGFLIFLLRFWKMLVQPRPDGK